MHMKKAFYFFWEIIKIVAVAALIAIPIRYFLFQPFFVKGQSMEPNFISGDYLIIDEISYRFKEPKRGEVIVFKYPEDPSQRFIKRIIGLPGEIIEIKNGVIKIYGQGSQDSYLILDESDYLSYSFKSEEKLRYILAEDEYFVLGDNRFVSFDSRKFGPLTRDKIIGKVLFRAWPFTALTKIEAPAY